MTSSEVRVRETFVELADTLVDDYDVIDFLDMLAGRVVELLGVTACGLLLADHNDSLNMVAASRESARVLELFQLQRDEGPCLECYRGGTSVRCPDLADADERWPQFAPAARDAGYAAVEAIPMRLRDTVVGALNVFSSRPGALSPESAALGQALADVATIGILHERTIRHYETVTGQLQTALNSRILIEQAKGVLAERLNISVDAGFGVLRNHARSANQRLHDVAQAVVDGRLHITAPPSSDPTR